MKLNDLTGKRFGRLTVISRADDIVYSNGKRYTAWNCLCDCGNTTKVRTTNLNNQHVSSCGCYRAEVRIKAHTKHGQAHHRLHNIWTDMKQRCTNPKTRCFANYGGRGIAVCDTWANDFGTFFSWAMGNGYSDELSIDRINVNGNYEPTNCRWATMKEQQNNKRNSKARRESE